MLTRGARHRAEPAADGRLLYCAAHRGPAHIDLKNSLCRGPGCRRIPAYGEAGLGPDAGRPIFCAAHRLAHHVDLKNRRCCHPAPPGGGGAGGGGGGCRTQATFGGADGALFCRLHRCRYVP